MDGGPSGRPRAQVGADARCGWRGGGAHPLTWRGRSTQAIGGCALVVSLLRGRGRGTRPLADLDGASDEGLGGEAGDQIRARGQHRAVEHGRFGSEMGGASVQRSLRGQPWCLLFVPCEEEERGLERENKKGKKERRKVGEAGDSVLLLLLAGNDS